MSDYEDDFDDYEGDFFYVEDEYMAADDLAEHAVASPPPATCGDDDMEEDWDRFDYFNDLEYASDGYDDAKFQAHDVKGAKAGLKRKRAAMTGTRKKREPKENINAHVEPTWPGHSPIVWRSHADRDPKPKTLEDDAQSYALFKNWREKLADTPDWAKGSPPLSSDERASRKGKEKMAFVTEPASPPYDEPHQDGIDDQDMEDEEEGESISKEVLLAALQRQLAAAGGPLGSMDPHQLLKYAMRMATNADAGDDIAGEMADAMLGDDDEEEGADADTEENLLSWVAQQRDAEKDTTETAPTSPPAASKPPPTPPSSEANRSIRVSGTTIATATSDSDSKKHSLKRKADADLEPESVNKVVKKRTTASFAAPTASSQARAAGKRR
ncbi:hypothetical protein BDW02DRAFT_567808 [Decorospora gaudefroyi]|uniref:Uncharacterized protein n=1 Tax=Decorospora gaudefroyi TaxID=184978 RepID=A0A6A5KCB0_9PLEO|nr:hypothetical protein BDW02DRAFT_567808 [Decorospora gaudefroyi]